MISPQIQHCERSRHLGRTEAPDETTAQNGPDTRDQTPALTNPALGVACPACDSQPGALCTSHSGTRARRHDVHRARTAALAATS